MIDLVEQIRIVAEQSVSEARVMIMWVCIAALAGIFAFFAARLVLRISARANKYVYKHPLSIVLCTPLLFSLVVHGSTKLLRITFDVGIADNGSDFVAQGSETNAVNFAWQKTNPAIQDDTILHFAKRTRDSQNDWEDFAEKRLNVYNSTLEVEDAVAYEYYVYHDWVPPSPVHTNGVWLGQVLKRARGCTNAAKMVVIHGQLMKDGKQIAPISTEETK